MLLFKLQHRFRDSLISRAWGFPTQEEAEAWASVYDKRWPQTPLTEVMLEEEALRAREWEAWLKSMMKVNVIEGGNKLAAAGHDRFICSGCGAEVCRPNRSFDDNSKCLKWWHKAETTT